MSHAGQPSSHEQAPQEGSLPLTKTASTSPTGVAYAQQRHSGAAHHASYPLVAVDIHGGDVNPEVVLTGVTEALRAREGFDVLLVGQHSCIDPYLADMEKTHEHLLARCHARYSTETIEMDEHPAQAVRTKRDSSIVQACRAIKEGEANAFFSAGSTGAILAAATLVIGRIHGVVRPAITYIFPSEKRPLVALDLGANAEVTPEMLLQFAQMGLAYAKAALSVQNPCVRLLNIGAEETKGSELYQQTYKLMHQELPGFAGNIESVDIFNHTCDVMVCDGFTGNILLKSIEGTAKYLGRSLKEALLQSVRTKVGALFAKPALAHLKTLLNADEAGGAFLLGVRSVVMIGHGHTSADAVKNGVLACAHAVEQGLVSRLDAEINR